MQGTSNEKSTEYNGINDRIVQSALDGDEKSFRFLVEFYKGFVYSIAYRFVFNKEDAEDISQDVFIKLWKNRKKIKDHRKLNTYLYKIVVNRCLNYKRKRIRKVQLDENIESASDPVVHYEKKHKKEEIVNALMKLKKHERIILLLHVVGEKSQKEIGEIMGKSRKSIELIIYRARKKLKEYIKRS